MAKPTYCPRCSRMHDVLLMECPPGNEPISEEALAELDALAQKLRRTSMVAPGPLVKLACEEVPRLIGEVRRLNLQNRELQERYDIYAQHLKSCVVFIAPEIPCDCGFLREPLKRNPESALGAEMTPMERILLEAVNEFCSCGGAGPESGCTACKIWHRHVARSRKV